MTKTHAIAYVGLSLALLLTVGSCSRKIAQLEWENLQLKSRLSWIETTGKRLAAGEGRVAIYNMRDCDGLLELFSRRVDLDDVGLEGTDVTDRGVECIAKMPNIRMLRLDGLLSFSDTSLQILTACDKLETLELTCTSVTDDGIPILNQLSNLRTLVLEQGSEPRLTNVAIEHLATLHRLRTLRLGAWASEEDVRKLQSALPECVIQR